MINTDAPGYTPLEVETTNIISIGNCSSKAAKPWKERVSVSRYGLSQVYRYSVMNTDIYFARQVG